MAETRSQAGIELKVPVAGAPRSEWQMAGGCSVGSTEEHGQQLGIKQE